MYVTIAANLNGEYHVVKTDYKSYAIVKVCPSNANSGKYVPWECFKYMKKEIY